MECMENGDMISVLETMSLLISFTDTDVKDNVMMLTTKT